MFHFARGEGPFEEGDPESLEPYIRSAQAFRLERESYRLSTVYGVSDFDQIGYASAISAGLIRKSRVRGKVLFWHPGQGHLPMFVNNRWGKHITGWILAGRDLLELKITRRNLLDAGVGHRRIETHHVPFIGEIEEPVDACFCFPDLDSGVHWYDGFFDRVRQFIKPGGILLAASRSTSIHRLMSGLEFFRPLDDKRYHGFRAVLFKKN